LVHVFAPWFLKSCSSHPIALSFRFAQKSTKLAEAMEEHSKFQTRLDEIEQLGVELRDQIKLHEEAESRLTEDKTRLEQLSATQTDELARARERTDALQEALELAVLERDELGSELQAARSKLDVSKTIHSLKLEQFQSMMRTNLEVADSIRGLMTKIDLDTPFPAATALRASVDPSAAPAAAGIDPMLRSTSLMSTLSASMTANGGNLLQAVAQREESIVKEQKERQDRIRALREKSLGRERAQQGAKSDAAGSWAGGGATATLADRDAMAAAGAAAAAADDGGV
jgi:hypothetical protein